MMDYLRSCMKKNDDFFAFEEALGMSVCELRLKLTHPSHGLIVEQDSAGLWKRIVCSSLYVTMEMTATAPNTGGRWGDREGVDYDNGHIIAAQRGGFGKRINLVPKDKDLNRGVWMHVESRDQRARVQRRDGLSPAGVG